MASSSSSTKLSCPESNSSDMEVDIISNLPEAIQCHILSFLTTKEAAATSILSTKWRPLWTRVPIIHLQEKPSSKCDHLNCPNPFSCNFSNIITNVLSQRTTHYSLKKLHLTRMYQSDPITVLPWIHYALKDGNNIEEMNLRFSLVRDINLPVTLFTCKTLVVLKLCGSINIMDVPSYVHLPSLKTADFMGVSFADVSSLSRILLGCPILEDFSVKLMTKEVPPPRSFKISNLLLKKLRISSQHRLFDNVTKLDIDTPSLVFLDIKDIAKTFTNTFNNLDIPEFNKLVHLEITISCCVSRLLVELLQKCPMLEVLVVKKAPCGDDERLWIEPTSVAVPDCLSSHLTVFKLEGYKGSQDDVGLAAYIMRSANHLNSVEVHIHSLLQRMMINKNKIQRQLSELPRASATCEIVVKLSTMSLTPFVYLYA